MTSTSRGGKANSSGTASYEEVNGKKRKVWRALNLAGGGGNNPSSGSASTTTMMSPEVAANYLQQAAALSTGTNSTDGGAALGPPLRGSSVAGSSAVSFGNLDLAALAKAGDLSALTTAAARSAPSFGGTMAGIGADGRKNKNGKDSLPCSEAEMKALMSMFVEIMGMSLDTDKLSKSTTTKKKSAAKKGGNDSSMFLFGDGKSGPPSSGWPDPSIAAATGDLDALNAHRYHYSDEEDDDDDDDSLPDLDDMKEVMRQQQAHNKSSSPSSVLMETIAAAGASAPPITGIKGIVPVEWESLEQIAIEDAMEAEERARKAAKRREKKTRKKEKARKEAATKAAEAAAKKMEKAILSWRTRVVSACQSNEVEKLEDLIQESPLPRNVDSSTSTNQQSSSFDKGQSSLSVIIPHLEVFLPHIVAKNRQQAERRHDTRSKLAQFVFNTHLPVVFTTPLRSGRTALHIACFHGELGFIQEVLERAAIWKSPTTSDDGAVKTLPQLYLNTTCQESGLAPIHYAVLSGSNAVLEALLKAGADVKTRSSDTLTWRAGNGKGITARELAESVATGQQDRQIETHGLALQEASNMENRRKFIRTLERMAVRLNDVEQNGYSPALPPEEDFDSETQSEGSVDTNIEQSGIEKEDNPEDDLDNEPEIIELKPSEDSSKAGSNSNAVSKKKKKKKKKEDSQQLEKEQPRKAETPGNDQDPLVTALLGMGFTDEQISAAVRACGGTDRATADDLVVWILSEGSGETAQAPAPAPVVDALPPGTAKQPTATKLKAKAKAPSVDPHTKDPTPVEVVTDRDDEARLSAQRLAAKREETRRRNREWNNKAQARQLEEEQAKIAQAVEQANRVANQRATVVTEQQQVQQVHSAAAMQPPPYPSAPVVPKGPATVLLSSHPGSAIMGVPPPGPYSSQMPTTTPPLDHNLSRGTSRMVEHHYPLPPSHDMGVGGHGVLQPSREPPMSHIISQYPAEVSSQYASLSVADDLTVSSYGSGRMAAPPTFSSSIPPGFRPTPPQVTLPPQTEDLAATHSYEAEENPFGEMRATAREFVPTAFKSSVGVPPIPAANRNPASLRHAVSMPPSSSTAITPVTVLKPPEAPMSSRLRAFSGNDFSRGSAPNMGMHQNGSVLLTGVGPGNFTPLSPVSGQQHLATPFDRLSMVTPSEEQQLPPVAPSATSSVGGLPAAEEAQLPGSMLETISSGLSSSSFDGNAPGSASAMIRDTSSIWGGIDGDTNDNANIAPNMVAGIPLSGLSSFTLGHPSSTSSATRSFAPRAESTSGQAAAETGFGAVGGWGTPSANGNTSKGRSIW